MSGDRWVNLLYLLPILLISMMVHELAHGWIAYRLGDPTAKNRGRLSLNPIRHLDPIGTAMFVITYLFSGFVFGWAKPIPVSPYYFRNRQRGMAIVGAAGPACNFIMAVIFGLILRFAYPPAHAIQPDRQSDPRYPLHVCPDQRRAGRVQPHPHTSARWLSRLGGFPASERLREVGQRGPLRHAHSSRADRRFFSAHSSPALSGAVTGHPGPHFSGDSV